MEKTFAQEKTNGIPELAVFGRGGNAFARMGAGGEEVARKRPAGFASGP